MANAPSYNKLVLIDGCVFEFGEITRETNLILHPQFLWVLRYPPSRVAETQLPTRRLYAL